MSVTRLPDLVTAAAAAVLNYDGGGFMWPVSEDEELVFSAAFAAGRDELGQLETEFPELVDAVRTWRFEPGGADILRRRVSRYLAGGATGGGVGSE